MDARHAYDLLAASTRRTSPAGFRLELNAFDLLTDPRLDIVIILDSSTTSAILYSYLSGADLTDYGASGLPEWYTYRPCWIAVKSVLGHGSTFHSVITMLYKVLNRITNEIENQLTR